MNVTGIITSVAFIEQPPNVTTGRVAVTVWTENGNSTWIVSPAQAPAVGKIVDFVITVRP